MIPENQNLSGGWSGQLARSIFNLRGDAVDSLPKVLESAASVVSFATKSAYHAEVAEVAEGDFILVNSRSSAFGKTSAIGYPPSASPANSTCQRLALLWLSFLMRST